jgi:hypothetical protein
MSTDKDHGKPGHLCSTLCGAAMLAAKERRPYTCPVCKDMDPLCLLVDCEERARIKARVAAE